MLPSRLVAVIDDEGEKGKNMSAKFLSGVTAGSVDRPHLVGLTQENTTSFDKVGISNDVILFGYPTSLGNKLQLDPALPLLRRGMVAGKTEDRRIVIDCPVYFGNSGGLVVEVDQHRPGAYTFNGIGIAVEMIPFVEELWSKQFRIQSGVRHENSGYTIVEPFDRITELVADLS